MKKIRTSFILGAGLGTRLRPLTNDLPKPLLNIKGRPCIEHIFDSHIEAGIERIIVNTHHLPAAYKKFYPKSKYKNAELIFVNEKILLDTGGAVKNIKKIIEKEESILIQNGDIFFDGNLQKFLNTYKGNTLLLLRSNGAVKNVSVNKDNIVDMRFTFKSAHQKKAQFTGIYIANKDFLNRAFCYPKKIFSSVDIFLEMIKSKDFLSSHFDDESFWCDIGSIDDYLAIQNENFNYSKGIIQKLGIKNISLINKGASPRQFFKVDSEKLGKLVLCFYDNSKIENFLYSNIAKFLLKNKFPVPKIFSDKNNLLIMSDSGNCDLLEFCKNKSENDILEIYKKVLKHIDTLHSLKKPKSLELCSGFDEELYTWEHNYFYKNCVQNLFKIKCKKPIKEFNFLIKTFLNEPQNLLHRDLQSQNIMISENQISFIDFQGLRLGCKYYDLASLIFDPYQKFKIPLRKKILSLCKIENEKLFYLCASQRLMQALGAYAFLSSLGKKEYLKHISPALDLLCFTAKNAGLSEILRIAQECVYIQKCKFSQK